MQSYAVSHPVAYCTAKGLLEIYSIHNIQSKFSEYARDKMEKKKVEFKAMR